MGRLRVRRRGKPIVEGPLPWPHSPPLGAGGRGPPGGLGLVEVERRRGAGKRHNAKLIRDEGVLRVFYDMIHSVRSFNQFGFPLSSFHLFVRLREEYLHSVPAAPRELWYSINSNL